MWILGCTCSRRRVPWPSTFNPSKSGSFDLCETSFDMVQPGITCLSTELERYDITFDDVWISVNWNIGKYTLLKNATIIALNIALWVYFYSPHNFIFRRLTFAWPLFFRDWSEPATAYVLNVLIINDLSLLMLCQEHALLTHHWFSQTQCNLISVILSSETCPDTSSSDGKYQNCSLLLLWIITD